MRRRPRRRGCQGAAKDGSKPASLSIAEVLSSGGSEEAIARMRVSELLEALPGIGKVRAAAIMDQLGIALRVGSAGWASTSAGRW